MKRGGRFKIFPNPVNDVLNFVTLNEDVNVKIYSLSGLELVSKKLSSKNKKINVTSLPAGIYIVVIDDGKTKVSKKIIVSK